MSLPAGFRAWCEVMGLDAFHPEAWSQEDHAAFQRWHLDQFRERWRWYVRTGYADLIRAQSGRDALLNHVRADLDEALKPLARGPWVRCPCHPHRFARPAVEDLPRGRAAVLAWLEAEFSPAEKRRIQQRTAEVAAERQREGWPA